MRRQLLALAMASALAFPAVALAQALPPALRDAGVTVLQWTAIQSQARQLATQKHISTRAMEALCSHIGIQLAQGHRLDIDQMIALLDAQADKLRVTADALSQPSPSSDATTARLLESAHTAVVGGHLDRANDIMQQAISASRAANEAAQRNTASIIAQAADLKSEELDLLNAADLYGQAAEALPRDANLERWKYALKQADTLRTRGTLFDETAPLQEAIRVYRDVALPLVPEATEGKDWASTQNHLGNALKELGVRGGDPQALQGAATAYRQAQLVWTLEQDPLDWAKAEDNLAVALQILGGRGDDKALADAADALRSVLAVSTRAKDPAGWARAQNNLGQVLEIQGERGGGQALRDAIAAFHQAVLVWTRDQYPDFWAQAQNNLGNTFKDLGDAASLRDAVAAFNLALEVRTRGHDPANWANTENDLGNALVATGDEASLHAAVAAFDLALEVRTRDHDPADWAATQFNLGYALEVLGERGDKPSLHASVAPYRLALEVFTQAQDPANWALVEDNLGNALETIGQGDGDAPALQQAVAAHRLALQVRTRDHDPAGWAASQMELGEALAAQGQRGDHKAMLAAVDAYRLALQVFAPAAYPAPARQVSDLLAQARAWLAKHPH